MTYLQDLVQDGLAVNVGPNPTTTDTLFKLADPAQPAAMTIYTSAGLGPVLNVLSAGAIQGFGSDDLGIGPMPGPHRESRSRRRRCVAMDRGRQG